MTTNITAYAKCTSIILKNPVECRRDTMITNRTVVMVSANRFFMVLSYTPSIRTIGLWFEEPGPSHSTRVLFWFPCGKSKRIYWKSFSWRLLLFDILFMKLCYINYFFSLTRVTIVCEWARYRKWIVRSRLTQYKYTPCHGRISTLKMHNCRTNSFPIGTMELQHKIRWPDAFSNWKEKRLTFTLFLVN